LGYRSVFTPVGYQGRNHVFKVGGPQLIGLGYYTEQNTAAIGGVHCRLLRNGNHTLHQKVGVVRPNFFGWSRPPDPPVVAPLLGTPLLLVGVHCSLPLLQRLEQTMWQVGGQTAARCTSDTQMSSSIN